MAGPTRGNVGETVSQEHGTDGVKRKGAYLVQEITHEAEKAEHGAVDAGKGRDAQPQRRLFENAQLMPGIMLFGRHVRDQKERGNQYDGVDDGKDAHRGFV